MLGANLMIRMIGLLAQHGPAIRVRLRELKASEPATGDVTRSIQDIFKPLSQELLEMSLPNGEDDLPLPVVMRDAAYIIIEQDILPKVLAKMYNDVWGWDEEVEDAKNSLKQQFLSTHANEYIHAIARLSTDKS